MYQTALQCKKLPLVCFVPFLFCLEMVFPRAYPQILWCRILFERKLQGYTYRPIGTLQNSNPFMFRHFPSWQCNQLYIIRKWPENDWLDSNGDGPNCRNNLRFSRFGRLLAITPKRHKFGKTESVGKTSLPLPSVHFSFLMQKGKSLRCSED